MKPTGHWESLPPMVKKREFHAAAFLKGKLYVSGGLNDEFGQDKTGEEAVHGSVECFDPGTKSWCQLPRMTMRRYHHACTSHLGCLVVTGGISPDRLGGEGPLATAERYDPSKQRWSQMPAMSTERSRHSLVSIDSTLYACGGTSPATTHAFEYLDATPSSWVLLPLWNRPDAIQTCLASTGCQGQLYILSCKPSAAFQADQACLQRFDPSTCEWSEMPLKVRTS